MSSPITQVRSIQAIEIGVLLALIGLLVLSLAVPMVALVVAIAFGLLYISLNRYGSFNTYLFLFMLSLILEKYSYYVGFSIRLPLIFVILTVGYFFLDGFMRGRFVIKRSAFLVIFSLLFLTYSLGAIWAIQPVKVIRICVLYVFLFALFLIAQHIASNQEKIETINKYFIITGILGATYGIYQVLSFFIGLPSQLPFVESLKHSENYTLQTTAFSLGNVVVPRINSTFNDPVLIGTFSAFTLMLLLGRIGLLYRFSDFHFSRKFALTTAALILFFCCVLTFSRSAWLGLVLGLMTICFLFLRYKSSSRLIVTSFIIVFVAFIILFAIFPPMSEFIMGRFMQSFDVSNVSTLGHLKWIRIALEAWTENPIFGVGLNNFGEFYAKNYQAGSMAMTHSAYFSFLSETGILGFILELTLIGFIFHHLIIAISRARRVRHYEYYFLLAGIIAAYVTILGANITYHFYTQFYVWFFKGFAVATASYVMHMLSDKTLDHPKTT